MKSHPHSPKSKPQGQKQQDKQPEPEASPQESLAAASADMEKWQAVAAKPGLSPQAAAWAREQARSAQASADLWQKALQPVPPQQNEALANILSLQDPATSLGEPNPPSSIKPGTLGSTL